MIAALLSFWSVREIAYAASLDGGLVIFTVALAVSLAQALRGAARPDHARALFLVPAGALAASATARLMTVRTPLGAHVIGDTVFTLTVAGTVAARRYGPAFIRPSILVTLPFIAQLITPATTTHHRPLPDPLAWSALAALICTTWTTLVTTLTHPTPPASPARPEPSAPPAASSTSCPPDESDLPPRPDPDNRGGRSHSTTASPPTESSAQQATCSTTAPRASVAGRRRAGRSCWPAVRLAVALALAFIAGRSLFGEHWAWPVLTVYVVSDGTRGRRREARRSGREVTSMAVLRIAGAAAGTVVATVCGGLFDAGSPAYVVLIFVVLAIGCALRPLSYAYWAAAATAVLALLYDYLGEGGTTVLLTRLTGILTGGLVAVAAAALLPLRRNGAAIPGTRRPRAR